MSLLPSTNNGASTQSYFIENIGGAGAGVGDAPCIKGSTLGAVRVGDPTDGLILRGDLAGVANQIRGGQVSGGSLQIGNSTTSFQNIVLTDGVTTVNGTLATAGAVTVSNGLSVSGDITLLSGAAGDSISGYYVNTSAFAGGGAVANPTGLTSGLYSVIVIGSGVGEEEAQASAVCFRSATEWFGNGVSFNFTAGVPNVAIGPVAGGATLNIGGAGIPAAGNVVFRKLMNFS
jgi:hypothetical protein